MVPGERTQIVPIQGKCSAAADEPRALCIVRDMSQAQYPHNKVTMNLPASTTAVQLMEEVGKKFQYRIDSFELVLQRMSSETITINEYGDQTLEDLGFRCGDHGRNSLIISDKNGEAPKKIEVSDIDANSAMQNSINSEGAGDSSSTYVPPPAPPPYTLGSSDFSCNYSYSSALLRQDTGFVGLVNQAMTCYLNSLLQTLFMTPEFRNTLYRWEFDGTEEEGSKSIPFQLQKLFLQLQVSKKPAVGTTELTTSFGWDSSEAWQQHDVQELCRVMFDALEQKFKHTEQADLISRLYEGKLKDYVKCLECGNESAREDTFLDVPLVVRPFGSSQAYTSVEEALHAFVTPETLQGSNQYFCERCSKKCDAHKGLKFTKFPYLQTLQLKRFDFDPVTMHRIKLNDRVSFPEILNLNEFIKTENLEDACDDGDTTDSGSALDDEGLSSGFKTGCSLSPEAIVDSVDLADDDEGIDVGIHGPTNSGNNHEISTNERNFKKSMEKGPYVYELFSIMVHSGSANGGHYYAYIKSFKDGEWYCFNDAQVSRITYDDIQKTYGGGPTRGYYSSAYSSSTNAYMLMYRQIDKEKNVECISAEDFPEHIKVLLQCMQEQEERDRQQRELDRCMCKIKLFCQHPTERRMIEMRLKVHKDCTLAEATVTAHKIMDLESVVPLECCRLVKYDNLIDSLESSFDASDDEPMGELLGGVKSSYKFDLLLETKQPQEKFQEYKPGGTTVKLHVVDLEREEVSPHPIVARSHLVETVEEFKIQIAKSLGIDASQLRLVLEVYTNELRLLNSPTKTLKSEGFGRSNKAFIEFSDPVDGKRNFINSKFCKILDRYSHTICMHVGLPKVDKAILEKLRIQDNDIDEGKNDSNSEDEANEARIPTGGATGNVTSQNNRELINKFYTGLTTPHSTNTGESAATDSSVTCSQDMWLEDVKSVRKSSSIELAKKNQATITPDDSSQDYDEGLGDSEIGDSCSSNGYHSSQAVHSDQSEDSSLTDSERTLVGDELSPRNNSPDIMGTEIEPDAEPLNHPNLEVSKPECDSAHNSNSSSNFLLNEQTENSRNLSSPEENTKDTKYCNHAVCSKSCVCDNASGTTQTVSVQCHPEEVIKRYFRAWPYTDFETGEKMLRVYVDKRITLADVKKELVPHVGVGTDCFKIYRLYSNNQEFECTRLAENLMSYNDDTRLTVKLGRALRKDEYKVKVYQLSINESEPCKYLIDWVFVKGMTVLQAKKEILPEIKERCTLEIPLNRCRLRKKSWKNPGTVFLDHQCFEKDIPINSNWELFLEVLTDAETVTSMSQLTVFIRRWHPGTYQLDPFQEVVLETPTVESLKTKISEVSNIPKECIEFAKGEGTFPCDVVSILSIHKELDWHAHKSTISTWSLCSGDDGHVVYFRDSREELKKLSDEEKREITNKENARSNKIHKTTYSPRKEKALKIYTLDSMPSSKSNSNSTESTKLVVPDLD